MAQHEELDDWRRMCAPSVADVRAINRTKPEHLPEDHVQQPH
jgi:hypothetical protein